jgi:hypothetical protein
MESAKKELHTQRQIQQGISILFFYQVMFPLQVKRILHSQGGFSCILGRSTKILQSLT